MAQIVDHLPSKHKILSSNHSIVSKRKNKSPNLPYLAPFHLGCPPVPLIDLDFSSDMSHSWIISGMFGFVSHFH
jgi:hypothetical protein